MLELREVKSSIGKHEVIHGVSLRVEEGELICLLGANGAGKSTLFRTISGIIRPRSGEILFQGEPIHRLGPDRIVRMGISLCPEGRKLFPRLSVKKNLMMGAYTRYRDREEVKRSYREVFELFPILEERLEQDAGTMSGGEQQMLAIARALMARPRLLMLDEPSLGLAPLVVKRIMETIQEINRRGVTILLSEQNASMALSISHRGYVLENGRIVLEGTSRELLDNEEVKKAYLGG
ncbi:MAG: ABC transporter ATP-binding protein [Candidatus Geothermincolales bacterium]